MYHRPQQLIILQLPSRFLDTISLVIHHIELLCLCGHFCLPGQSSFHVTHRVFLAQVLLEYVNGSISTLSGHNKKFRPLFFSRPIHRDLAAARRAQELSLGFLFDWLVHTCV
jgi:hypothetical protein